MNQMLNHSDVWETIGFVLVIAILMAPRIIRAWKGRDQ